MLKGWTYQLIVNVSFKVSVDFSIKHDKYGWNNGNGSMQLKLVIMKFLFFKILKNN